MTGRRSSQNASQRQVAMPATVSSSEPTRCDEPETAADPVLAAQQQLRHFRREGREGRQPAEKAGDDEEPPLGGEIVARREVGDGDADR